MRAPACLSFGPLCNAKCALKGRSSACHARNLRPISRVGRCLPRSVRGPLPKASPSALASYKGAARTTHVYSVLSPSALLFGEGIIYSLNILNFGKDAPIACTIAVPLPPTYAAVAKLLPASPLLLSPFLAG